jgi:hypothetical protein
VCVCVCVCVCVRVHYVHSPFLLTTALLESILALHTVLEKPRTAKKYKRVRSFFRFSTGWGGDLKSTLHGHFASKIHV